MLPLQPTYQRRAPQRHRSEGLRVSVGHTWISVFDARRATFRPLTENLLYGVPIPARRDP